LNRSLDCKSAQFSGSGGGAAGLPRAYCSRDFDAGSFRTDHQNVTALADP